MVSCRWDMVHVIRSRRYEMKLFISVIFCNTDCFICCWERRELAWPVTIMMQKLAWSPNWNTDQIISTWATCKLIKSGFFLVLFGQSDRELGERINSISFEYEYLNQNLISSKNWLLGGQIQRCPVRERGDLHRIWTITIRQCKKRLNLFNVESWAGLAMMGIST